MTYSLEAQYLDKSERASQKNGRVYYQILVKQGAEVQALGVPAELYTRASELEMGDTRIFEVRPSARSGGQYGSFLSVYCTNWTDPED